MIPLVGSVVVVDWESIERAVALFVYAVVIGWRLGRCVWCGYWLLGGVVVR